MLGLSPTTINGGFAVGTRLGPSDGIIEGPVDGTRLGASLGIAERIVDCSGGGEGVFVIENEIDIIDIVVTE
jgi:hypothetical protein